MAVVQQTHGRVRFKMLQHVRSIDSIEAPVREWQSPVQVVCDDIRRNRERIEVYPLRVKRSAAAEVQEVRRRAHGRKGPLIYLDGDASSVIDPVQE